MNRNTLLWNECFATIVLPTVDFIPWMHKEYFLKCERQQLCYEILKRLQVEVRPMKSDFKENRVSSLNKIAWTLSLKLQYEC